MSQKNLFIATLLLLLVCSAYSQRYNLDDSKNISIKSLTSYNRWRNQNKRNYLNDDQQLFRQLIFLENLQKIEDHNNNPNNTYTVDTNQFSDMTQEEFVSRILNGNSYKQDTNNLEEENTISFAGQTVSIASSIDWRTKGAVTAVKNQGRCGACWAFSTTGVMESFNFIQNKKLQNFSEQQIVDCAITANGYYAYGCGGGTAITGLNYSAKFGVVESSTYPYVGAQGKCKITSPTTGFKPKTFGRINSTVNDLKTALNKGPVSVSIDATLWNSYKSGVFNGCSAKIVYNHAVLAVGYDVSGNWIVKNSWGTSWGESGYIRMAPGNTCGILTYGYTVSA